MSEDDPKEWEEVPEVDPPENLKRKWVVEDHFGKKQVPCPACRKLVPADSLTCLFCDATVCQDSGPLGRIVSWLKRIFR